MLTSGRTSARSDKVLQVCSGYLPLLHRIRLTRRGHVIPVAEPRASGQSGSSGPDRECDPNRVGRRGGCELPTIGLPPAAERAHRILARSTRPVAARTRRTHLSRAAAARGPRRRGPQPRSGTRSNGSASPSRAAGATASSARSRSTPAIRFSRSRPRSRSLPRVRFR